MRIKINEEEKKFVLNYFKNLINIKKLEEELLSKYPSLIKSNDDGTFLEILNDYYVNEEEYDIFKNSIDSYINNNYKKMLLTNNNIKSRYFVKTNLHDSSKDNFVKNGSLVLKINRIIDSNGDLALAIKKQKEFETYLFLLEKKIENVIGIPVKFLFLDIVVPIKK